MRTFLLTRARPAFGLWCVPAILCVLAGALSGMKGWALLIWYGVAVCWILAGAAIINFQALIALRPALAALDNRCDPEPLLELSRTVCRQNPDSLLFQVYEGYALSLLGRIKDITGGDSLEANIRLVYNNARLASAIAVELSR